MYNYLMIHVRECKNGTGRIFNLHSRLESDFSNFYTSEVDWKTSFLLTNKHLIPIKLNSKILVSELHATYKTSCYST